MWESGGQEGSPVTEERREGTPVPVLVIGPSAGWLLCGLGCPHSCPSHRPCSPCGGQVLVGGLLHFLTSLLSKIYSQYIKVVKTDHKIIFHKCILHFGIRGSLSDLTKIQVKRNGNECCVQMSRWCVGASRWALESEPDPQPGWATCFLRALRHFIQPSLILIFLISTMEMVTALQGYCLH